MTNLIGISGKLQSGKDTITNIIQWLLLNQDKGTEIPFDKFDLYKEAATWKNVKFADKLKDMVCLLLGCTREQLEDPKFKEKELGEEWIRYAFADGFFQSSKGTVMNSEPCSKERYEEELRTNWQTAYKLEHTPRTILQMLGTQCGRFIHPNIWINATFAEYKPQHFRTVKHQGSFVEHLTTMPNWIISDVRFPNEAEAVKDKNGILIRINRNIESESMHESETALDNFDDWDYMIDNDGTIEDLIEKVKEILIQEKIIYDNKN